MEICLQRMRDKRGWNVDWKLEKFIFPPFSEFFDLPRVVTVGLFNESGSLNEQCVKGVQSYKKKSFSHFRHSKVGVVKYRTTFLFFHRTAPWGGVTFSINDSIHVRSFFRSSRIHQINNVDSLHRINERWFGKGPKWWS